MSLLSTYNSGQTYYVIIGCGFSAILNHLQLVEMNAPRIQGLTILHIGSPDPWLNYRPMPMGQWPCLLSLPGYGPYTVKPLDAIPLDSADFGNKNDEQWNILGTNHPASHLPGKVVSIRKAGSDFELKLDTGQKVKAEYIDICGGPGPARHPKGRITVAPVLQTEFETRTSTTVAYPRVTSGEGFLTALENRCPSGSKVCVYGGASTAAWCVESAQRHGCEVVWLANESVNDAFVASRRNDGLVAQAITRVNVRGDHVVRGNLSPRSNLTTFGEHVKITHLLAPSSTKVEVSVSQFDKIAPRWVARSASPVGFSSAEFDQVVCAIGQEKTAKEPNSWAMMTKPFLRGLKKSRQHFIVDSEDRVVGLKNVDEKLRVLGAAALNHPDVDREWRKKYLDSYLYFRSLPEQARVPIGIAVAANTLAAANGFALANRPPNINMCGLLVLGAPLGSFLPDFAETVFSMRGVRMVPYTEQELYGTALGFWSFF